MSSMIRRGADSDGVALRHNVGFNVVGWILPALTALVAVPLLVRGLGTERFGLLALAWTTLGYFGLFDLGLGRAVTHAVGDRLGTENAADVPGVIWTALALLVPVGVAGALLLFAIAPWLMTGFLEVPAALRGDAITSYRLLALAVPFVGAAAVLRGTLEAQQRFGLVNAIRIPYGMLLFAGPVLVLPFSRSLVPAIAVLVTVRIVLVIALTVAVRRAVPGFPRHSSVSRPVGRRLLTYGGWMTVSNVVSPLMNTFDQYVIGAVLGVGLVTFYASPFELVTKLWLFTAAVYPVFFAALSFTGVRNPERSAELFDAMLRVTAGVLFVPAVVLAAFAPEILTLWLGVEFAGDSARVLQILAIAVFVNTLGQAGLNLIQSLGRPDLTGKYHLAELPVYAALLWVLLPRFGIAGAAIAWAVRAVGDALLLLLTCPRVLPQTRRTALGFAAFSVAAMGGLGALLVLPSLRARVICAGALILAWLAVGVSWLRDPTALVPLIPWRRAEGRTTPDPRDPAR